MTLYCNCKKKGNPRRMDGCMRRFINQVTLEKDILASCCGHGKYPASIVVRGLMGEPVEVFSNITIRRKVRFYKKDKQGYYYIPEVQAQEPKLRR